MVMNKMLSERSYLSYLKFLNENCPIDEEWEYNDKVYQIKVNADDVDTINDWVEKIVGCSFFYDCDDDSCDSVNLKITKSTLESHLRDKIIEDKFDYTPIKMDRFSLVKGEDHYNGGYHVVDNLIKDISKTKCLYKTGIIFTACSDSESVNFNICQEVLRLLNTEESYVNMLDYVNDK